MEISCHKSKSHVHVHANELWFIAKICQQQTGIITFNTSF